MKKIIIAPDSFKETMSNLEVTDIIYKTSTLFNLIIKLFTLYPLKYQELLKIGAIYAIMNR